MRERNMRNIQIVMIVSMQWRKNGVVREGRGVGTKRNEDQPKRQREGRCAKGKKRRNVGLTVVGS